MKRKVFCIGFHKTGTTSLKKALQTLGYRVTGPNGVNDPDIASNVIEMAHALVAKYDAFQDNPWPVIFREMDAKYPGSKFILSLRDSESWIKSQVEHFGSEETPMRKWIYGVGCPKGNETIYLSRFESHNKEVLDYFDNRPDAFLVMNLASGHGWERLCAFLGSEVPKAPFPHANQAGSRDRRTLRGKELLRKISSRLSGRAR
jgi:Sulfotransferase domain